MEYLVKSSVKLVKPGLIFGFILIVVSLIAYIFAAPNVVSYVVIVLMVLDFIYMFIYRNKVYKIVIKSMKSKKTEDKFLNLFKSKSAVILVYDGNGSGSRYVYRYVKKEPMRSFIATKNLIKDDFKVNIKIKFNPFGSPTGIVKKSLLLIPIQPTREEIKKHKITVIED